MHDCLILGGGVIGLSLAYELANHGCSVRVIDRGSPGEESSWAGAGILAPGSMHADAAPLEQLAGLSHQLHPEWARRLREETGLDNGYRRCGGLYVAPTEGEVRDLRAAAAYWSRRGIAHEWLDDQACRQREPGLASVHAAVRLDEEGQLRNPRHLKALLTACAARGVEVSAGIDAEEILTQGSRVAGVRTSAGELTAANICLAAGSWSHALVARLGWSIGVRPIRGQMVLLSGARSSPTHVINAGHRYLVPRGDGRVLIGSTEEDVGFDKRTTGEGIAGLLNFGLSLVPSLAAVRFERCWAGLRPGSADGLPYLGRLPGLDNAFIAAGHHRQGLQLSCATAVVMGQLIRSQATTIDLSTFRVDR